MHSNQKINVPLIFKAAEAFVKAKSKFDAANAYVTAGKMSLHLESDNAIQYYLIAIELFTDLGKFTRAADIYKEIAIIHEKDLHINECINYYQLAADLYETENLSTANHCFAKIAEHSVTLDKYSEAVKIYDKLINYYYKNNLLQWHIRDYFLKIVLSHLANNDLVSAKNAIVKYEDLVISSDEYKFALKLITIIEEQDSENFLIEINKYQNIHNLEDLKVTLLARIQDNIGKI